MHGYVLTLDSQGCISLKKQIFRRSTKGDKPGLHGYPVCFMCTSQITSSISLTGDYKALPGMVHQEESFMLFLVQGKVVVEVFNYKYSNLPLYEVYFGPKGFWVRAATLGDFLSNKMKA